MRKLVFVVTLIAFTACNGGAVTPPTISGAPANGVEEAGRPFVAPPGPRAQTIYFAANSNSMGASLLGRFSATADGQNVLPSNVVTGSKTQMEIAATAFVDKFGAVWTCDVGYGRIEKFRAAATGNVAPQILIDGPNNPMTGGAPACGAVAIDAHNRIFAANDGDAAHHAAIYMWAAGSNGNVAPQRTITGTKTQLNSVSAIALDAAGDIYVANAAGHDLLVFGPTATGNAAPIRKIAGANTLLKEPSAIAYDARTASVYVVDDADTADASPGALYVYPATGHGNIAPAIAISGSHSGIDRPIGVAVDQAGYVYVGNWPGWYEYPPGGNVTVYAPGTNGNSPPAQTIGGGPNTDLVYVGGLTVK